MSVTVIIPCHKRHEYLVTVLESIKHQTAFSDIDTIIVSENSDDDKSKLVCDRFPELNITYYKQPLEITAVEHIYWLINQSKTDYTAILHDDDWWYPTHLESALKALSDESIAAYFSNFVFAKNEILNDAHFHNPSVITHFTSEPLNINYVCLSFADVASICYLFTPFHMSSMVARTSSLKHANEEGLKDSKPWYADRILYPYLALHGNIIFNPQVLCGVRNHEGNGGNAVNLENRYAWHLEGSMKISELAKSRNVNVIDIWKGIYSRILTRDWHKITDIFHAHFGHANNDAFVGLADTKSRRKTSFKSLVKEALPYGLVTRIKK